MSTTVAQSEKKAETTSKKIVIKAKNERPILMAAHL
jgi:hypothetical protein